MRGTELQRRGPWCEGPGFLGALDNGLSLVRLVGLWMALVGLVGLMRLVGSVVARTGQGKLEARVCGCKRPDLLGGGLGVRHPGCEGPWVGGAALDNGLGLVRWVEPSTL